MINAINNNIPQQYNTSTTAKQYQQISEKENAQQNKSDVYVPSQKTEQKELYYGLEQQQWKELANKYDVENLEKEQREKLVRKI